MKNLVFTTATVVCIQLIPLSAQSRDMIMDAENLLQICTTAHPDAVGFCNGFMQAAHDFSATANDPGTCAPEGTTRAQLATIYEKSAPVLFAENEALELERVPALFIARIVLEMSFPCENELTEE